MSNLFFSNDLFQRMDHIDQVCLILHIGVYIFVCAGYLVKYSLILAAFHSRRLYQHVVHSELPFGLGAAYAPPGAVGARTEGI